MFSIISKLHNIADKLEDIYNRDDLANLLDKIAIAINSTYKQRIRKPIKGRGTSKVKRHLYYKMNKQKMRIRMKIYRKTHKMNLKKRKNLKHFHRF
jgi:hypothetical protein